jgi:hypothetical protein
VTGHYEQLVSVGPHSQETIFTLNTPILWFVSIWLVKINPLNPRC